MTKKTIFLVVIALIIAIVLFSYLASREEQPIKTPTQPFPSREQLKNKKHLDQSGFSFVYPENFVATAESDIDTRTYSSLIISSKSMPGNIKIIVEDSNFTTLNDWYIQNNVNKKSLKITTIKLGDLDGQQFQDNGTIKTIALDNNVLFTLNADIKKNKAEWTKLNDSIIKSFVFTPPPAPPADRTSTDGEEDILYEGEEVIE